MGRRHKNKPKQAKPELGKGVQQVTYIKFRVTFRCSNEKCQKVWQSAHGWREDDVFCEFCENECKIVNVKDEMLELDNYVCPGNHRWQSIHDDGDSKQECEECGGIGNKDGSQNRFGRHFWFICNDKNCGIEWEDFSLVPSRTQRCGKMVKDGHLLRPCASRGDMIKVERINQHSTSPRERRGDDGGGSHVIDLCDMCLDLRSQGYSKTCMSYRKVKCEVLEDDNGGYTERIVDALEKNQRMCDP